MDADLLLSCYQNSVKLVRTDIAYLKRNCKLVDSVDMGNIYEKVATTVTPLLKNQKLFTADDIDKRLVLKSHPDKDPDDFLTADHSYSYSLKCYIPDTDNFLWFFRSTQDGEDAPFVADIGNHHVPDNSLIIIKTYEEQDAFSGWTQKDYVRQATVKDLLKFLYRLNHLLNKFSKKINKLNHHFSQLERNNSNRLNHFVGVGDHTKIEK